MFPGDKTQCTLCKAELLHLGVTNVGIVSCPSFFLFKSLSNRNTRYLRIAAMLQLKKDSDLIISPEKLKIKQPKDRKNIFY